MQKTTKNSAKWCGHIALKACVYALSSLLIYSLLALLLTGCAQKIVTVEKPVPYYVPQVCMLNLPLRPDASGEIVTDIKNVARYAEQSEAVAIECGARP